jgi:hypothetical protein
MFAIWLGRIWTGLGIGLYALVGFAGTFEAIQPNPVAASGPYEVTTFALSKDGHYVVYFFTDGTIRRWDIRESAPELKDKVLLTTHPKGELPDFRRPPGLAVSGDGRFIAFQAKPEELDDSQAATNRYDIYLWDSNTNFDPTSSPITLSVNGGPANGSSTSPTMTHDGRFVAFTSQATNLTLDAIDSGHRHIFVYDRQSGKTTLASANRSGLPSNGDSDWPAIAQPEPGVDAGHVRVAFQSDSSDLIEGDANVFPDIFVYDNRATPKIYLVSQGIDGASQPSNYVDIAPGSSLRLPPTISGNGKVVAFASSSAYLVDDDLNGAIDVFVRDISDLGHGVTMRVSLTNNGVEGNDGGINGGSGVWWGRIGLNDDGSLVSFPSDFPEIAFPSKSDLVIRDTRLGVTRPVGNKSDIRTLLGWSDSQFSADGKTLVMNRTVGENPFYDAYNVATYDAQYPNFRGLYVFHDIPQPVGTLSQILPFGREAIPNELVTLDTFGSHPVEPNSNAVLKYRWEMVKQPGQVITEGVVSAQQNQPQFTFTPPVAGYYQVRMTVNDGIQDGVPKIADLMVRTANGNVPPMAQTSGTGSWIWLKEALGGRYVAGGNVGSWFNWARGNTSYDPDNHPGTGLTYRWVPADKFSRTAKLRDQRTKELRFKPTRFGVYRFNLIVSDGEDESVATTQEVYTTPIVDVETPSDTQVGETIELSMDCQNAPEPKRYLFFVSKDDGRHWVRVGSSRFRTISWKVRKRFASTSAKFKACSARGATYRPLCATSEAFVIKPTAQ